MPAGQPIIQSSAVTPGHVGVWTTDGVLQDGGPATEGAATAVGITANGGISFAISSANPPNPYVQYGVGVSSSGVVTQYIESYGGAPTASLVFNIDGTDYAFPGSYLPSSVITQIPNIATLRASTTGSLPNSSVYVLGYNTGADGGDGPFWYNPSDTTSADNGGTIIIDTSGRRWYRETSGSAYNVKWFGATGNGATDDTAAIQAAINALPVSGGKILFPPGTYLISSTIKIGNGTSSAVSTRYGVILEGLGQSIFPTQMFTGYPTAPVVHILWAGGAAPMFQILGPLQGWGVQNSFIDGVGTATYGIEVVSAQFGDSKNLTVSNCVTAGIYSTTVATFAGVSNTDSLHNAWKNITIFVPNSAGAKGIVLTGDTGGTSNTDYNDWTNVQVLLPPTAVSYAIYLQSCDSNTFRNVHFEGGAGAGSGVTFDYTVVSVFPAANSFFAIDPSGPLTAFQRVGTPSVDHLANYIIGLDQANGATYPNILNLSPGLPVTTDTINLIGQTSAIGSTALSHLQENGIFRISVYLAVNVGAGSGTISAQVFWNDDAAAQSATTSAISLAGDNYTTLSVSVRAIPAASLSYATTLTGSDAGAQYNLHIVVEQIGPDGIQA